MVSISESVESNKNQSTLKNAVDIMVNRVKKAEIRIASLEGELNTLHHRMQAASDMLGLPKKKSQGDSGELLKKWLAPAGGKKNLNMQSVKGSDEISKFIQKQESKPQASKQLNVLLDNLLNLKSNEKQLMRPAGGRVHPCRTSAPQAKTHVHAGSSGRSMRQESRKPVGGIVKKVVTVSKVHGTHGSTDFLDPITLREIVDPVCNMYCMHVYEKASIYKHISGRTDVMCPYPKCYNHVPVHMSNLLDVNEARKPLRVFKKCKPES